MNQSPIKTNIYGSMGKISRRYLYDCSMARFSQSFLVEFKASSSEIKVSPPRFYESNEVALADMKKCAELENN